MLLETEMDPRRTRRGERYMGHKPTEPVVAVARARRPAGGPRAGDHAGSPALADDVLVSFFYDVSVVISERK